MVRHQWFGYYLIAAGLLSWVSAAPATAQQQVLTDAEVYRLRNNVQLLLRNQQPRPAQLNDRLVPQDALRTALNSVAELLFNEGSIARVDANSTFRFESGMRRFQLQNRIAMNETIFILESGIALIISPPDSVGTRIQTPESQINLVPATAAAALPASGRSAQEPVKPLLVAVRGLGSETAAKLLSSKPPTTISWSQAIQLAQAEAPAEIPAEIPAETEGAGADAASELLPSPDRSSAVMVVHDAAGSTTQVFALTPGVSVGERASNETIDLLGGQTVAATSGQLSEVQEFDLEAFYQSVPLAAGLGPDQESVVAQEPAAVQASLNAVRTETIAAVAAQARRLGGFANTFLQDALGSIDREYDGQRGESSFVIIGGQETTGTFVYNEDNDSATFTADDTGEQTIFRVDFDDETISIDGQGGGVANDIGLSGNNASGTIIFEEGRATRIEVFDVDEDEPDDGFPYRGTLTEGGIAPDR